MLPAEEVLPAVSFISFPSQGMGNIIHYYIQLCVIYLIAKASLLTHFYAFLIRFYSLVLESHYETQMSDRPITSNSATKRPSAASLLLKFHAENRDLFFEPPSVFCY